MIRDTSLCFLGYSFVNGTGDEESLGWAGRACAAAHSRGAPIICYTPGVRRNISKDIMQRWEVECFIRLPEACDGRSVLSCGVNDTVIENGKLRVPFDKPCKNVYEFLHGDSKCRLLMMGPPSFYDNEKNQRIEALE